MVRRFRKITRNNKLIKLFVNNFIFIAGLFLMTKFIVINRSQSRY